jgi:hypothetical protein
MTRLEAYRQIDIEVRSYWKPQEAQMISTMVEYLQGIQMANQATTPDKDRLGNPMIPYEYFTRANDVNTRYTMYLNTIWRQYY